MSQEQESYQPQEEEIKAAEESMTPDQEEMSRLREKETDMFKNEMIGRKFGSSYFENIADCDEKPESYIWEGRRILRATLQCMVEKLLATGKVTTIDGRKNLPSHTLAHGHDKDVMAQTAAFMFELKTEDPNYKDFVEGLNDTMRQYDKLYYGSVKIRDEAKLPNL